MTPAQLAVSYRTIAVDGTDGTGKTTLVDRLRVEHGFTVVHCARTPDDVDLLTRYRQILAVSGPLTLDRCFLSELVYGPLCRGRSRISWDDALDLTRAVTARQGVFVHLSATADTIRQRLLARDGASPSAGTIDQFRTAYEQIFAALAAHAPVVHIDTTRPSTSCG